MKTLFFSNYLKVDHEIKNLFKNDEDNFFYSISSEGKLFKLNFNKKEELVIDLKEIPLYIFNYEKNLTALIFDKEIQILDLKKKIILDKINLPDFVESSFFYDYFVILCLVDNEGIKQIYFYDVNKFNLCSHFENEKKIDFEMYDMVIDFVNWSDSSSSKYIILLENEISETQIEEKWTKIILVDIENKKKITSFVKNNIFLNSNNFKPILAWENTQGCIEFEGFYINWDQNSLPLKKKIINKTPDLLKFEKAYDMLNLKGKPEEEILDSFFLYFFDSKNHFKLREEFLNICNSKECLISTLLPYFDKIMKFKDVFKLCNLINAKIKGIYLINELEEFCKKMIFPLIEKKSQEIMKFYFKKKSDIESSKGYLINLKQILACVIERKITEAENSKLENKMTNYLIIHENSLSFYNDYYNKIEFLLKKVNLLELIFDLNKEEVEFIDDNIQNVKKNFSKANLYLDEEVEMENNFKSGCFIINKIEKEEKLEIKNLDDILLLIRKTKNIDISFQLFLYFTFKIDIEELKKRELTILEILEKSIIYEKISNSNLLTIYNDNTLSWILFDLSFSIFLKQEQKNKGNNFDDEEMKSLNDEDENIFAKKINNNFFGKQSNNIFEKINEDSEMVIKQDLDVTESEEEEEDTIYEDLKNRAINLLDNNLTSNYIFEQILFILDKMGNSKDLVNLINIRKIENDKELKNRIIYLLRNNFYLECYELLEKRNSSFHFCFKDLLGLAKNHNCFKEFYQIVFEENEEIFLDEEIKNNNFLEEQFQKLLIEKKYVKAKEFFEINNKILKKNDKFSFYYEILINSGKFI